MKLALYLAPVVLAFGWASAQDATRDDVALGLEGLMEAAKDPALLAQLLQDMQVRLTKASGFLLRQ